MSLNFNGEKGVRIVLGVSTQAEFERRISIEFGPN